MKRLLCSLFLCALGAAYAGAEEVVLDRFSEMMDGVVHGAPLPGSWQLLWNSSNPLGDHDAYVPLVRAGKAPNYRFVAEGRDVQRDIPAPAPGVWTQLGRVTTPDGKEAFGGTPGMGTENAGSQGFPHGVVVVYQVSGKGKYGLRRGELISTSAEGIGNLRVMVWVGSNPAATISQVLPRGEFERVEFELEPVEMEEGERLYVTVDPQHLNRNSNFLLDFEIIEIRE